MSCAAPFAVETTSKGARGDRSTVDQAYETDAALAERFERDTVPLMDQLFSGAMRLTGSRQDAEDLVQETMLRAYSGFRSFSATNLKAWLYRIMHNTWIDAYRKQQRRPVEVAIDQVSDHQSARYAATAPTGLGSAEIEALEALPDLEIQAALLSLPEAFRMAVYYADVEGFSYAEIAAIMGTSKGAVTSRLHRGRTRLRELLFVLATERGVLDRKAAATASMLTPFTQPGWPGTPQRSPKPPAR
ncbi:MAG TPA: sigma-70 family RNA polymerase sigma factor [Mycobacterium sp.]|nr:sigma-70 family RNA polymerase sigma factor [Mycobacterium sp.]